MRILYVTTISLTMNSFFKPHIDMLVREGHQIDIACNYNDLELDKLYTELGCVFYQIDFSRSPFSANNLKAYGQLKTVIENGNYDIVHCHTPNASVITRLACRKFRKKKGLKVFYTAHGFHFYKGAPKLNWMIYYPIEKFCSRFTDKLIMINQEDYELAKNRFKAKEVHYVPGVGIDLKKFAHVSVNKAEKRKELGIPENAVLLLSVGELNENKNHETVIRAIADMDVYYIIAGKGALHKHLQNVIDALNMTERVKLLGFCRDVGELYKVADIFVFPSLREGLSISVMEAMMCGIPIVCSKIRGNVDLIDENSGLLVDPHNVDEFATALLKLSTDSALREKFSVANLKKIEYFSTNNVLKKMYELYHDSSC